MNDTTNDAVTDRAQEVIEALSNTNLDVDSEDAIRAARLNTSLDSFVADLMGLARNYENQDWYMAALYGSDAMRNPRFNELDVINRRAISMKTDIARNALRRASNANI